MKISRIICDNCNKDITEKVNLHTLLTENVVIPIKGSQNVIDFDFSVVLKNKRFGDTIDVCRECFVKIVIEHLHNTLTKETNGNT